MVMMEGFTGVTGVAQSRHMNGVSGGLTSTGMTPDLNLVDHRRMLR